MRGNVLDRKIADRKQVSETDDRRGDARCCSKSGIAAAGDQLVMFKTDAEDRCNDGIRRHDPGKRQGELAKLCCHVIYSFFEI